jgi:hypothetical protein
MPLQKKSSFVHLTPSPTFDMMQLLFVLGGVGYSYSCYFELVEEETSTGFSWSFFSVLKNWE